MYRATFIVVLGLCGVGCADETVVDDVDGDVGSARDPISGAGSFSGYQKALVRLDLQVGNAGCSGVLVGPNLLVTAAHCVADRTTDGVTTWNGMHYGKVKVRMVYKPTASETMCLNETCRDSGGNTQYSTVFAFWDDGYSGEGDWSSDFAVLTRMSQADFLTKAPDPGDPAPRTLASTDFMRITNVSLPTDGNWIMTIAGYGAASDNTGTVNPRLGYMDVDDWNTHTMVANYDAGAFWATTCAGDSGGPMSYTAGIGGTTYLGGITLGTNDAVTGSCPEVGDDIVFGRASSKVWLLNKVRQWIEGKDCNLFTNTTDLPGSGQYYRCW